MFVEPLDTFETIEPWVGYNAPDNTCPLKLAAPELLPVRTVVPAMP